MKNHRCLSVFIGGSSKFHPHTLDLAGLLDTRSQSRKILRVHSSHSLTRRHKITLSESSTANPYRSISLNLLIFFETEASVFRRSTSKGWLEMRIEGTRERGRGYPGEIPFFDSCGFGPQRSNGLRRYRVPDWLQKQPLYILHHLLHSRWPIFKGGR